MIQICKFDSIRDLGKHRPCLSIDINQVFETHELPTGGGFDTTFPDVSDINQVGPRIEDNFDAIEAGQNINSILSEFTSGTGNNVVASPDEVSAPSGE